jgi:uncharacterized protein
MTMLRQFLNWTCEESQIVGILHDSQMVASTGIVIIPGGTQTRTGAHRLFVSLADALAQAGYPTLRFDPRGRGDSSGTYPGFENLTADISAAIQTLRSTQPKLKHVVLLGHCDGAAAAAFAASSTALTEGLVLLNPWARTDETRQLSRAQEDKDSLSNTDKWKRLLTGKVNLFQALASRLSSITTSGQLVIPETGLLAAWASAWPKLALPTLVITGSRDASGKEFLSLLPALPQRSGVSTAMVVDGDHSFSDPTQAKELISHIINYLNKKFHA